MADQTRKPRKLEDIVRESQSWDPEYLLRNLEEEMDRMEHGMHHMVWGSDDRPVTRPMRPLPMTPKFEVSETESVLDVKVHLPDVPEEHIRINVDKEGVEVLGCSDDPVCKPYYVKVDSKGRLDPDSTRVRRVGATVEVKVDHLKKKRVPVK